VRRTALAPLALLLLVAPGALATSAEEHTWAWRVLGSDAQVKDDVLLLGPGPEARLQLPPGAHDVQAYVNGTAVPWEWVAPGTLLVHASQLGDAQSTAFLEVLYVVPLGAAGLSVERTLTMDTRSLDVRVEAPEGWTATVQGQALGTALGPLPAGTDLALRIAPATGPSPLLVLGGMLALVLVLTMARARTARGKGVEPMGLLGHLQELAMRVRVIALVTGVLMLVLFTFELRPATLGGVVLAVPQPSLTDNIAAQTFRLLSQQFVPPGVELVVTDPISAAMVQVEVALALAVLVGSPLIAYEAGAFLVPALEPGERRLLLRAIPAVTGLFLAGAAFAYLVMVPTMMRVLYSYALGLGARSFLAVDSLVSFAVIVTLIFGLSFELPVFMVVLAKLGLVTPRTMQAKWRHVIVGIFVVSAVITPDPSVVSQVLVAVPLCVLYGIGLWASKAATRAPAGEARPSAA
jgi:sec-independent protein translocase protein TatC